MQFSSLLSQIPGNITEYFSNSNYLLPLLALFFVRFFLSGIFRSAMGLLVILPIVLLIISADPALSSQLSGLKGFQDINFSGNDFSSGWLQNNWMLLAVFALVIYFFRPIRLSVTSLLLLSAVGYLLFFRDYRPSAILSDGNWKTSAVGAALLLVAIFLYRRRQRFYYAGQSSFVWFQPLLLGLALVFSFLILKNPVWLEAQLPGWKNSIGFVVLAASGVAFFYNLPVRFRPYAISACWLFVIFTVYTAIQAH